MLICSATLVSGCAGTASPRAASHHRPRTFSVAQVEHAFGAQGVVLHEQQAPAAAHYIRLASSGSLRLLVWRSVRDANAPTRVVEVITGSEPAGKKSGRAIVLRLGGPGGRKLHVNEVAFANVDLVYLQSDELDAEVRAALHALHAPIVLPS